MPRFTSIENLQEELLKGNTSCLEIVEYYISRIEESKELNSFVEVFEEEAIFKAKKLDEKIQDKKAVLGKLFGVVISVKDNICIQGKKVTAASDILEGFESTFTATAIQKLIDEEAIIIGRTNCDEFAMGSANSNSRYGAARNGVNPEYVPGGSSGGSAVSVQMDCCLIGIGSDTGGSVRQPAGFCSVIGFKPSYGRISRYGLLAYASSFDQIGILAHSVQDVALISEIMYGHDKMDATSSQKPIPSFSNSLKQNLNTPSRVACLSGVIGNEEIDIEIRNTLKETINNLKQQGHQVEEVDLDILEYAIPAYYVLTTAEATSNLSRYDGVRFGYRNQEQNTLLESYKKSRTEGFGKEVKRRIMLGNFVLSSGYYEAYFKKAQQVRKLISEQLQVILEDYDFMLLPVSPTPPWKINDKNLTPIQVYLSDIFTVLANLAGVPAISLPVGKHKHNNLPIGVQFMSAKYKDEEILRFSYQLICNK